MSQEEMGEFHSIMGMLQLLDVGLCVLDRDYRVCLWNAFMENHSGRSSRDIKGRSIFDEFPELPRDWFIHKTRALFTLNTQVFSNWEQRPYLFRFNNYRPITGVAEHMYQNVTLMPLVSVRGEVEQIGILVYDVTDVAVNKQALLGANRELERLSRTDRLTQLNNRGYWEERLQREFKLFQREQRKVSLVMFDIDHFKRVNDNFGHPVGDEVIRVVANCLRQCLRETDIGGRYGGEEFAAILVGADAEGALVFAERLRLHVAAQCVLCQGEEIRITVSVGVAELTPDARDPDTWLARADQALYRAKSAGRNCAVAFDPAATE